MKPNASEAVIDATAALMASNSASTVRLASFLSIDLILEIAISIGIVCGQEVHVLSFGLHVAHHMVPHPVLDRQVWESHHVIEKLGHHKKSFCPLGGIHRRMPIHSATYDWLPLKSEVRRLPNAPTPMAGQICSE